MKYSDCHSVSTVNIQGSRRGRRYDQAVYYMLWPPTSGSQHSKPVPRYLYMISSVQVPGTTKEDTLCLPHSWCNRIFGLLSKMHARHVWLAQSRSSAPYELGCGACGERCKAARTAAGILATWRKRGLQQVL
jgi:hypothetical protein